MNCISGQRIRATGSQRARRALARVVLPATAILAACGSPVSGSAASGGDKSYDVSYTVVASPDKGQVHVELELEQARHLLREMSFDAAMLADLRGDGRIDTIDGRVRWRPPERGGSLSWRIEVANERNSGGYDAWLDGNWGLFRAEDIIPRAATRTLKGATARTRMRIQVPQNWSVVTEYFGQDDVFPIVRAERRFGQPTGWIVMGELGVRIERIAGVRVVIAAPEGQGVRRLDMLALLSWTLPELARILPALPERLAIVSAGNPMWRGALSAPRSVFVHAERPLISENGTSTLLHELMHVALGMRAASGFDWIVEGLAEFYSLELLRRSGTQSAKRHDFALEFQAEWADSAKRLCAPSSTGARTALAVVTLAALDAEIRSGTQNDASLDEVLLALIAADRPLDLELLRSASREIIGRDPAALRADRLPGCPDATRTGEAA